MSTIYRVKVGETETCGTCGTVHEGGDQMIRLKSYTGERLGNCCFECYEEEQEDIWL